MLQVRLYYLTNLNTDKEELYNYTFTGLKNLPGGPYTVRYIDSTITKSVVLQKVGGF